MFEAVHTINEWYDGPELGVADFEGRPHVYERITERNDGEPEIYRLSPIDPEKLTAVLEDWQLWLKWNAAPRTDEIDDPRVLPEDLPRHQQLKPVIDAALKVDENKAIRATGNFVHADGATTVEWQRI